MSPSRCGASDMAASRRNPLKPASKRRKLRKVAFYITEGETERDYLAMRCIQEALKKRGEISLKMVRGHRGQTDPASLVRHIKKHLSGGKLHSGDSAWIVMDRDEWTPEQLKRALKWGKERAGHHAVISNPKFEVFLLQHFEDCRGRLTSMEVDARLQRHWNGYNKHIPTSKFDIDQVKTACQRSRARSHVDGDGIPVQGSSEVHQLVEYLIGE